MPVLRLLCLAVLLALLAVPAARAAELTIRLEESSRGVHFGQSHTVTGTLKADDRTPLAGQQVILQGRPFPFQDPFGRLAAATTASDGTFALKVKLTRNTQLRAVAAAAGVRSGQLTAHLFPDTALSFRQIRPGVILITQRYRVPRDVRLGGKTLFYVAPRSSKTSTINRHARTRRVRAGRFQARVTVAIPAAWRGRFRFAACYRYTPGSGLGDPKISCPRSGYRF